jgi:hypothetical protein
MLPPSLGFTASAKPYDLGPAFAGVTGMAGDPEAPTIELASGCRPMLAGRW